MASPEINNDQFSQDFFAQHPEKIPTGPTTSNKVDKELLAKNVENHNKAVEETFKKWYQRVQKQHE
jgi:hypothetical protein